ncbi:KR domain protein [Leptospira yanagawae serovar Saopaulo str. Sao Paulo = ATCC 700523]|uniref:SDR family NAD(P)-dependent oxidoreductase n=2 Tax=Leptospira yanagawae TaxID=293069 RepID=A0ABY2M403_9LEPT|nr:SDR family NAD(P)-dependent oxidoreductase [Leptospira yanagawae]EOQ88862.1 KR domain protein [Leptospira yanagawae serovar Saopaulo str. Sao Paulo = ATCC 700523]TGL23919.1 SDR family NAD(P)-dependent oxidoreductase [Leptospira yanagawae]
MKLYGNTVLITGCGMGIGALTAERLAKEGNDIIGIDINLSHLKEIQSKVESLGKKFYGFACDLSKEEQISSLIKKIKKNKLQFQILINNAGIAPSGPYEGKNFSVWEKALKINVHGPMQLVYESLPILREQNEATIINLASIAGKFGTEGTVTYSATKHAMVGFSQALKMELYDTQIGVSWICPSMAKTRMIDGVKPSFFTPVIEPIQVADAICKAIQKNPGEVLVPSYLRSTIVILPALFPKFSLWLAVKTKASKGWLLANKGLEKNIPV